MMLISSSLPQASYMNIFNVLETPLEMIWRKKHFEMVNLPYVYKSKLYWWNRTKNNRELQKKLYKNNNFNRVYSEYVQKQICLVGKAI